MLPLNDKKVVQENVLLNCKYPMGFRLGKSNEKSPTQQMQPWRNRNFLSTPPKQLVEIHTYISWYSSCVKIDSNALGLHRWTSSKKRRSHGPWPTNGPLVGFPEYAHQADSIVAAELLMSHFPKSLGARYLLHDMPTEDAARDHLEDLLGTSSWCHGKHLDACQFCWFHWSITQVDWLKNTIPIQHGDTKPTRTINRALIPPLCESALSSAPIWWEV